MDWPTAIYLVRFFNISSWINNINDSFRYLDYQLLSLNNNNNNNNSMANNNSSNNESLSSNSPKCLATLNSSKGLNFRHFVKLIDKLFYRFLTSKRRRWYKLPNPNIFGGISESKSNQWKRWWDSRFFEDFRWLKFF